MRKNSIPMLLITGFLGSGKTTILNQLLKNSQDQKIGVIVNDFGDINIDSMLVASQTDTQINLQNGCICCSVDEEDLDGAIAQMAHKGSLLDYIVIEASGLAEPRDLATMLRLLPTEYAHFDGLVHVVDGLNFADNNKSNPGALDALQIADVVVITKIDLIDEKTLKEIEQGVYMANENARIIRSSNGMIDSRLLLEQTNSSNSTEQLSLGGQSPQQHAHLHEEFDSISFNTAKPLDPVLFESWMKKLSRNIFRAKGICYFGLKGVEQKFIFHSVSGRSKLKLDEWGSNESPGSNLVVIGTNLDKEAISSDLEGLIDVNPDDINQETLMDIYKYR